jgi:hypothetical protein
MNRLQRAVLVLGAVGMVIAGVQVMYVTRSGETLWGIVGHAPQGAFTTNNDPTMIAVACVMLATATLYYATKSRKG